MEDNKQALVYSEVYAILNSLDKKYKNSVPTKLYNLIKENREKNYTPTYDMKIPLSRQNVSKKAAAFLCLLHYNYWCTSEEEKAKINKVLEYNYKKNREKYFKYEETLRSRNRQINIEEQNKNEVALKKEDLKIEENKSVALTVLKESGLISSFFKFIKRLFQK